jgi:hypothetical protein
MRAAIPIIRVNRTAPGLGMCQCLDGLVSHDLRGLFGRSVMVPAEDRDLRARPAGLGGDAAEPYNLRDDAGSVNGRTHVG